MSRVGLRPRHSDRDPSCRDILRSPSRVDVNVLRCVSSAAQSDARAAGEWLMLGARFCPTMQNWALSPTQNTSRQHDVTPIFGGSSLKALELARKRDVFTAGVCDWSRTRTTSRGVTVPKEKLEIFKSRTGCLSTWQSDRSYQVEKLECSPTSPKSSSGWGINPRPRKGFLAHPRSRYYSPCSVSHGYSTVPSFDQQTRLLESGTGLHPRVSNLTTQQTSNPSSAERSSGLFIFPKLLTVSNPPCALFSQTK